jgi:hypothetical protein
MAYHRSFWRTVHLLLHKRSRSHHGRENDFFAKAFAMLGFIRRLSLEFRDPYILKSLYTFLVRPKLWNPFYDVRVDRVERVKKRFIRYALRGLGWTDMHDLPPYEDRCVLLHLDTLKKCDLLLVWCLFAMFWVRKWTHQTCCPCCVSWFLALFVIFYPSKSTQSVLKTKTFKMINSVSWFLC